MRITQFDAKTGEQFTTEIEGPSYAQKIVGEGYFILINPDSKHVSFCKQRRDICFGDIVSDIIPNYTNQQYCDDYGDKMTGYNNMTVRQYMQVNCRMREIV